MMNQVNRDKDLFACNLRMELIGVHVAGKCWDKTRETVIPINDTELS